MWCTGAECVLLVTLMKQGGAILVQLTFDEATFLEIIEIGTRPTVTIRKNNYVFDFGKPVANVEWVRFCSENFTNNSDVFTLSISDDGSSMD